MFIVCRSCLKKFARKTSENNKSTEIAPLVLPENLAYVTCKRPAELSGLAADNTYVKPAASNFKTVDSIAFVGNIAYLFQTTSNLTHTISRGVLTLFAEIPEKYQVKFIWVLFPEDWQVEDFNSKIIPSVSTADVAQFAKKLPLVKKRVRECIQTKIALPFKPQQRRRRRQVTNSLAFKLQVSSCAALWRVL